MENDPYIIDGVVQWGPFQGARQEDLLDEEWNCDAIVPKSWSDGAGVVEGDG